LSKASKEITNLRLDKDKMKQRIARLKNRKGKQDLG